MRLLDKREDEWQPVRHTAVRGIPVRLAHDGPTIDDRLKMQAARLTSNKYRSQLANDNQDWPLKKLLNTEGNAVCLAWAERYRDLFDAATSNVQMIGKDASENVYVLHRSKEDESTGTITYREEKVIKGKKSQLDTQPNRATAAGEQTKKRAAPVPKKWQGDWPLLNKIDASYELARLRAKLGPIIPAFEAAVIDSQTLEDIGKAHGIGNKGAAGAGRALVFLGFDVVGRFWGSKRMAA